MLHTIIMLLRPFAIAFFITGIVCGVIWMHDIYQAEHDRRIDKKVEYEKHRKERKQKR